MQIWGVHLTEMLLFAVMTFYVFLIPGTKVEESFNMQGAHDIIYYSFDIEKYDHHEFPGVVPRTFAGPAFLAVFSYPARALFSYFDIPKYWMQIYVRCILGFTVFLSLANFGRTLKKWYGGESASTFRIIMITQFHFLFYASRTLPNTFATPFVIMTFQRILDNKYYSAVKWATVAVVLFRCELVLLFGPMFILLWLQKHIHFVDFGNLNRGAIPIGITTAIQVLVSTIPLDSLLWERLIYPELEVAWFNIVENRSHEYGVQPFLWYFMNALPRCMLSVLPMTILAPFVDRTSLNLVLSPFIFVFLYSFLPHKELRFILYVVPALNAAAAIFISKLKLKSNESSFWNLLHLGTRLALLANIAATVFFTLASINNYPSWYALKELQEIQKVNGMRPISLHIDVACAQTGVTRFMQLYDSWEYNKGEELKQAEYKRFDFRMVGTYENNLKELISHPNYSASHQLWFTTKGFSHFEWRRIGNLPVKLPTPQLVERVAVLKKF